MLLLHLDRLLCVLCCTVAGVLFKFATDDHRIYGSELAAQKAAGNEIRAMNAIIDLNVAHLHTTLSAMFLLRGHCKAGACRFLMC